VYNPNTDPELEYEVLRHRDVYLAGPFFTLDQVNEINQVEEHLEDAGLSFFSPRIECRYKLDDPPEVADRAFYLNVHHIRGCKFVLAGLTWRDTGTAWELGLAYGCKKPMLGWTNNLKVGLNIMARKTVDALIPLDELSKSLPSISVSIHDRGTGILHAIMQCDYSNTWKGLME
jgi:nucleoside 2-deoxyribosyltransferase